jgi:hypothetical protein
MGKRDKVCDYRPAKQCDVFGHYNFLDCDPCHQAQNVAHREDQTAFDEGSKPYLCVSCAQEARAVKQANRDDPMVQLRTCLCTGQIKSTRLCHVHRDQAFELVKRKIALRKEWAIGRNNSLLACMVCERHYGDSDTNAWRFLSCWEIVVLYYG